MTDVVTSDVERRALHRFGKQLSRLLTSRDIIVRELVAASGVGRTTVRGYLTGQRRPGLPVICRLVEVVDVLVPDARVSHEVIARDLAEAARPVLAESPTWLAQRRRWSERADLGVARRLRGERRG